MDATMQPPAAPAAELGKLLFEHRVSRKEAIGFTIIGGVLSLGILVLIAIGYFGLVANTGSLIIVGISFGFGPLILLVGLAKLLQTDPGSYLVHEHGMVIKTRNNNGTMLFRDATEVSYGAIRVQGLSTNEELHIRLGNGDDIRLQGVRPRSAARGDISQASHLMNIANIVATHIARNMVDALARGESLNWISGLSFCQAGIVAKGMVHPWAHLAPIQINEGYFHLRTLDGKGIVRLERANSPNFMAVCLLIRRMQEGA